MATSPLSGRKTSYQAVRISQATSPSDERARPSYTHKNKYKLTVRWTYIFDFTDRFFVILICEKIRRYYWVSRDYLFFVILNNGSAISLKPWLGRISPRLSQPRPCGPGDAFGMVQDLAGGRRARRPPANESPPPVRPAGRGFALCEAPERAPEVSAQRLGARKRAYQRSKDLTVGLSPR